MDSKSSAAFPTEPPDIHRCGAEDLISGLPDELLHAILVRLPSAAAAARTSVISRRWRGVWAHMPELVLCLSRDRATPAATAPSALLDSVDAALNSYAAPTLSCLKIDIRGVNGYEFDANRVAEWLRFASQRVAGKLCISLNLDWYLFIKTEDEVALPICERATEIDIIFRNKFLLRPPPTGSFSCLTDLKISWLRMDGVELGRVVSSVMCPRLRKLGILGVSLDPNSDVCICSESIECLDYNAFDTGMLEVNAPKLQGIHVSIAAKACCIAAPKLENIKWTCGFDPDLHQFDVVRRHLKSLSIIHDRFVPFIISSTRLMERYDTVKELTITLGHNQEISGYMAFLKETDKIPVCETLVIKLVWDDHGLLPKMLHLLRRCSCIRKFKLLLSQGTPAKTSCTTSGCPCLLPESCRSDDVTFDSLEEIGIGFFTGSTEQQEFVEALLSRCNMVTLKRLDINVSFTHVSSEIMKFVERIRTMCCPNSKVQINVIHQGC